MDQLTRTQAEARIKDLEGDYARTIVCSRADGHNRRERIAQEIEQIKETLVDCVTIELTREEAMFVMDQCAFLVSQEIWLKIEDGVCRYDRRQLEKANGR